MQEHSFKHLTAWNTMVSFNYFSIALIDKTDGKNPKKKEDYWRRTLKTYSSFGRNIKDSCGVVQFW